MRLFITILFTFTISVCGLSQYEVDWRNAPLNPVPVKYTLNQFQLHGPVKKAVIDDLLGKKILFFNTFGKLDSSITDDFVGHEKKYFEYDNQGNLSSVISQNKYQESIRARVVNNDSKNPIQISTTHFKYNQAGYLISVITANERIEYSYNKDYQLSKKQIFDTENKLKLTVVFSYKQYIDFMRVKEVRITPTVNNDNLWVYEYEVSGHLKKEGNLYDTHGNYLGNDASKPEGLFEYYPDTSINTASSTNK